MSEGDLLDFSLPVTGGDVRALDAIRYAHPLPFPEYLAFLSRWSSAWVHAHGGREPDADFGQPFRL